MDLVRKSARGKNPVMHKNNNKGAELAGEMLAGSAFSVYANNEPKSALARDLGDCRDNKGKLAKRVFTCSERKKKENSELPRILLLCFLF